MGALLATLGFEWNPPKGDMSDNVRALQMPVEITDEQLVDEITGLVTRNLYRDTIYMCDFYRGLDERIPSSEKEDEKKSSVWRINVDHPLVYVLVAKKGQQPIHIVDDLYGTLVVYNDDVVQEGIRILQELCSKADYTILNQPAPDLKEDEKKE